MLLKTFARSLKKNKFFSSLNVLGLSLGMAVFLLAALYVKFETSYEDFNKDAASIYRVNLDVYVNNEKVLSSAENYPAAGPALAALPEVTAYTRLYNLGYKNNVIITNEEAKPDAIAFKHRSFLYADSSFLSMMGYTLVAGDINTALAAPNSAVITQHYATLYFGGEDPIGKTLRMRDDDNNNELVHVTGVVDKVPANTHLKFDILFSYKTLFSRQANNQPDYGVNRFDRSWFRSDMYTFIRLMPGTDVKALEAKLPGLVRNHTAGMKPNNERDVLSLQPLKDIHLTSHLAEEAETNGDERIVYFIGIIGLFVLAIALINYINLTTAQVMERAREVGVRKVMGAMKHQLITQFLTEAACINMFSVLVAYAVVGITLPFFNTISGLSLHVSYLLQPWFLTLLAILWIAGTLLSGFYPALVLTSFKPVAVVKGKLRHSAGGIVLRKSLVVFQFMASVSLIASTLIVFNQLEYMLKGDIGMNIDHVLVVERPSIGPGQPGFNATVNTFRNELKSNAVVEAFTMSSTVPGKQREYKTVVKLYGASDDQLFTVRMNSMDFSFQDVYNMKLLAGRMFSEDFVQDPDTSVVITESTARLLGFKKPEDAVGQTLTIPDWYSPVIVGVVNDYHQVSLKSPLEPTVFFCDRYDGEFYSMRVNSKDIAGTVNQVKAAWEKSFPGNPIEYFFLDDYFNRQYKNERQFGMLFTTFSALALVIGCLGLLGLSAYTAAQRTKEIGIRKVLGSSEAGIFTLLSGEYIRLISVSIALAVPLVYILMDRWIQSFPYRTSITAGVFIVAGVTVLLIALFVVSFQTWKAARENPVVSLRSE
jgi:putative ABC transport system permease protein